MADQVRERWPDNQGDEDPPETGQPIRGSYEGGAASERRKAETEIAAGDVADDLADFA